MNLIESKIQAYFTPAEEIINDGSYGHESYQWLLNEKCKPEHKVDGKVPFQTDIQFDGRSCDCGRCKYIVEECGCSIKEYRLIKYPNE